MFSELNILREITVQSIVLRFFLAMICGGIIGFERGKNFHSAGLRTHIVVCIGSTSVMVLNQFLIQYYDVASDPARLGAQVISGIGFLGAGTIVITGHQRGQQIKGLTTAAGLWATACMGLMIGSAFFEAAIFMCCFLYLVISVVNHIDARFLKMSTVMRFYIEYSKSVPFSSILQVMRAGRWHLSHIEYIGGDNSEFISATIDVQRSGKGSDRDGLLELLRQTDGVLFVMDV